MLVRHNKKSKWSKQLVLGRVAHFKASSRRQSIFWSI